MKPGDKVYIPRLRDEGVVESEGRGGVLRLKVDGKFVELPRWEVEPLTKAHRKHLQRRSSKKSGVGIPKPKGPVSAEVDLHGMTVEDALSHLNRRVNEAILAGADRLAIVHGIGTGRVKVAVHAYLRELPAVEKFQEDPGNPGLTWVYF